MKKPTAKRVSVRPHERKAPAPKPKAVPIPPSLGPGHAVENLLNAFFPAKPATPARKS